MWWVDGGVPTGLCAGWATQGRQRGFGSSKWGPGLREGVLVSGSKGLVSERRAWSQGVGEKESKEAQGQLHNVKKKESSGRRWVEQVWRSQWG